MTDLVYLLTVWLGLASFLAVWFHTDIAPHIWRWVFTHFRNKEKNDGYWPEQFYKGQPMFFNDWSVWINTRSPYYGELFTCPWCLSVRAACVLSLLFLVIMGPSFPVFALAVVGGPWVSNYLLKKV